MMLIRDVPLVSLQRAVFSLLKNGQTIPVYGEVIEGATLPYITIGSVTLKPVAVKTEVMWMATINIDIWAARTQKKKVNEVLNDIGALISYPGNKIDVEGYECTADRVDLVEAFPEETTGYHGTMTVIFELQKKGY